MPAIAIGFGQAQQVGDAPLEGGDPVEAVFEQGEAFEPHLDARGVEGRQHGATHWQNDIPQKPKG